MNILVVGDIHGCYFTFKKLLEEYWNSKDDLLIQAGDLIDRGKFSPETVKYCRELELQYPDKVVFIKGNHEFEIIEHYYNGPHHNWLRQCGDETMSQYESGNFNLEEDIKWFSQMPLYWSNDKVFVSHAGIAEECENPYDETASLSVLWNRDRIKNIGKLQVMGHTPCEGNNPSYDEKSNSWIIDTGLGYGGNLTALRLSEEGELLEVIKINTVEEDK
jgi:serine/threonine protein phosphatase 1